MRAKIKIAMDRAFATEPASWPTIIAYGKDQAGEAAEGRGPMRRADVQECYTRYIRWCAERGHTSVEFLLANSMWHDAALPAGGARVRVALEPNIVPYHCSEGIE